MGSKSFTCYICNKTFPGKYNLNRHCRNVHHVEAKPTGNEVNLKCDKCEFAASSLTILRNHYVDLHGFKSETRKLKFSTRKEFNEWKENEERNSNAAFVANTGAKILSTGGVKRYFVCHRSGTFKSKGQGKRKLKSQGSCKIQKSCLSSIEVLEEGGEISVTYHGEHYGHSSDIVHLPIITGTTGKLPEESTIQSVFDDFQDSDSTGDLSRIHLLMRQDLDDTDNCKLTCSSCKNCMHVYNANCPDYVGHFNICKHVDTVVLSHPDGEQQQLFKHIENAVAKGDPKNYEVLRKIEFLFKYVTEGKNQRDEVLLKINSCLDNLMEEVQRSKEDDVIV